MCNIITGEYTYNDYHNGIKSDATSGFFRIVLDKYVIVSDLIYRHDNKSIHVSHRLDGLYRRLCWFINHNYLKIIMNCLN